MLRSVVLAALLGASSVLATKCSLENKCPEDSPCCSREFDQLASYKTRPCFNVSL